MAKAFLLVPSDNSKTSMILPLTFATGHAIIQFGQMTTCAVKKSTEFLDKARKRGRLVLAIGTSVVPIENKPLPSKQSSEFPLSKGAVRASSALLDSSDTASPSQTGSGTEGYRLGIDSAIEQNHSRASDDGIARRVSHVPRESVDAAVAARRTLLERTTRRG